MTDWCHIVIRTNYFCPDSMHSMNTLNIHSAWVCSMVSHMWNTQREKETKEPWWAHPPPRSLKCTGRQDSALWEISMSKKILWKVVVILRFGRDTLALLDKLSALTPPWKLFYPFVPKPGNPLISPPLPALCQVACSKDPYWQKEFLFIYFH